MQFDERLIDLISGKQFLYDKTDENYRNNDLKDQEWNNIANELDTSTERCKKRWASLRDRYKRIRKQGPRSGGKRRWKHFDALCFVPLTTRRNNTLSSTKFEEDELLMADTIIEKEETQLTSPQHSTSYNKYDYDELLRSVDRVGRDGMQEMPPSEASNSQQEEPPSGTEGFFTYLSQRVKAAKLNSMQEMRIEAAILNFTVDKLCEITKQKRNG